VYNDMPWTGSRARAFVPSEYYASSFDGYAQILRERRVRSDEIGTHAGLADTSLQLAVVPQMVRVEELRNAAKPGVADGVYGGDPRHASSEFGQLGVEAIVAHTVKAINTQPGRYSLGDTGNIR
jgi:creatinine amidohydrolase